MGMTSWQLFREEEIYSNMVDKTRPSDYFVLALREVECQHVDNK